MRGTTLGLLAYPQADLVLQKRAKVLTDVSRGVTLPPRDTYSAFPFTAGL